MRIPDEGSITVNEYVVNRPKTVTLPGGAKREYSYDPLMRVSTIQAQDQGENVFLDYRYFYDKAGNITAKETEHGRYDYGYDDLYRLTASDNPVQADEAYSYDAVGNRLTAEGVAGNWSYNDNNELQAYAGVNYEYDNNGNLIKKTDAGQITNYIYNAEDRLERVEDGSGSLIASYYYDPFGRRVWKEVNGVRTYLVYADEGLVAEMESAGNVIKSYGYKPGSTWTTDPLFMKDGGEYYFYQNDHLGTPQKMTAVNGAIVWSAEYSSFGVAEVHPSSSIINNLRFPGQYFDAETGLHYNYHRYYNPDTGRYMSVDPIESDSGDNLYSYANNMPVQYGDVRGMYCERISPWKRVTAIENDTDKAKLLSRTVKGKWKKINEWVVLAIPGRNMPRGGGSGKIGYACQWEKVGCLQTSIWQKPVLHEAKFRCGIGNCPKKEWEETRRKELNTQFTVVKELSWRHCLYSFRKKTTYSSQMLSEV